LQLHDLANSTGVTEAITSFNSPNFPNISTNISSNSHWSTNYTRHVINGDGNCFFSAVNFCMTNQETNWTYNNVTLRQVALRQLQIDVHNNPIPYKHHLENPTNSFDIEILWNTIRGKYENNGQYADHDLMMSTVSALNFDIQLHGQSNTLLTLEDRIVTLTIHLLYCGIATLGNRGNHYDALIPIINISVNSNNTIIPQLISSMQQTSNNNTPSIHPSTGLMNTPIRNSSRLLLPNNSNNISNTRHRTRTNYDHTRQFIENRLRHQNRTIVPMEIANSYAHPTIPGQQITQLQESLQYAAVGQIPVIPLVDQKSLISAMNRFATNQYTLILEKCYICKERWFSDKTKYDDNGYQCNRCFSEGINKHTFGSLNMMNPFHMSDTLWNEYIYLPELSEVEKRLIALRTIVFSIYRLKGGSTGCTGDAVNLIQDISEIARILPRGIILQPPY